MTNYNGKKNKKGTGQHAISNKQLKALLQKQGFIKEEKK